ncbi:MAG TPA: serine/threonine-protein kinase [Pseudomonadota bacterium]|nr:serine/threonine-protein kinase [Pseudomonadota bacterium]
MVGRTLAHYRLLELVGHGGMASVFRAHDEQLDREVAIKVMHPHLATEAQARQRFSREARAVARLRHENILEIYAASDPESPESSLVTEFVSGPTLRKFFELHGPLPAEIVGLLGWVLADALAAAHEFGIVHRDVKPENVMIRTDGRIVLCDFGIARLIDNDSVTNTGQLLGSPAYIAPEHISGQPQDGRSDLFALGVLLYEALSAELPFSGRNPHETLTLIARGEHKPIGERVPGLPRPLEQIVEKLLSCSPDDRYPTARNLGLALLDFLRDVGLATPREQLRSYFLDPEGFWQSFLPQLVETLIKNGKARAEEGRTAAALSDWGRVLLLSPGHAEAEELIARASRLKQRRRIVRTIWISIGAAAACVGLAVLGQSVLSRPKVAPPLHIVAAQQTTASAVPISADTDKAPVISVDDPSPVPAETDLGQDASTSKPKLVHRPLPVKSAAPTHVVRLEPWPKSVTVTHNGKRLGAYGTDVRTVQLGPGPNEFLFESQACYSEKITLPAGSTPEEVRVRLRWKPALLQVRAHSGRLQPSDPVDILVDGHIVGRGGQVMAIPVSADEGHQAVSVQVGAPGHKTHTENVQVRANQLLQLDVDLPMR